MPSRLSALSLPRTRPRTPSAHRRPVGTSVLARPGLIAAVLAVVVVVLLVVAFAWLVTPATSGQS